MLLRQNPKLIERITLMEAINGNQVYFFLWQGWRWQDQWPARRRYGLQKKAKTLIVTTDPASNLADDLSRSSTPGDPIQGLPNLWAMEIDSIKPPRIHRPGNGTNPGGLSAPNRTGEEQMSGPCTAEVAAFDRHRFLEVSNSDETAFDVVIFDTAPTGHTFAFWNYQPSESINRCCQRATVRPVWAGAPPGRQAQV